MPTKSDNDIGQATQHHFVKWFGIDYLTPQLQIPAQTKNKNKNSHLDKQQHKAKWQYVAGKNKKFDENQNRSKKRGSNTFGWQTLIFRNFWRQFFRPCVHHRGKINTTKETSKNTFSAMFGIPGLKISRKKVQAYLKHLRALSLKRKYGEEEKSK